MSYQVRITETAKQDLREIAFYIAERAMDNEIAKRFVIELREQCMRLVDFSQSGAMPKDRILRSFDFRYIVYEDYLIFYSIDEAQKIVNVLAIFNSKKDYLRVMRKFGIALPHGQTGRSSRICLLWFAVI